MESAVMARDPADILGADGPEGVRRSFDRVKPYSNGNGAHYPRRPPKFRENS
jgi:hypothetical protein